MKKTWSSVVLVLSLILFISSIAISHVKTDSLTESVDILEQQTATYENIITAKDEELSNLRHEYGHLFWLLYEAIENENAQPAQEYLQQVKEKTDTWLAERQTSN